MDFSKLILLENLLAQTFKKDIKSNIIKRLKYPQMLNTKFVYKKGGPIIIENSLMSVPEFIENNLMASFNITVEVGKIFINDQIIKYPLIIKKIKKL